MALIDQAMEWIGDMLEGARSSLRGQRAQSVFGINSSFLPTDQQNGHRSAPEAVTYGEDSPNFKRLKQYCLRAFGGQEYNRDTEAEEMYRPISSKSFPRGENNTVKLTSTGSGNTSSCLNPMPQYSTGSVVNTDIAEFSGGQHIYTSELSIFSYREYEETSNSVPQQITAEKEKDYAGRRLIHGGKEAETEAEETFTKICSVFGENISTNKIQKNTLNSSKNKCIEKARSLSCRFRPNLTKKHTGSTRLSGNNKPEVSGKITLGLQHFKKSGQLRVILLSAETYVEHDRKMFCKVNLIGNSSSQKLITQKSRSNSGNVDIRETFNMGLKVDDLNGYVLKVQLRIAPRFLRRKSTVGVAYIALENFDLMFDTTMSVKLRDSMPPSQVSSEGDVEIISENRSIHAEVTALREESDHPDTRYSWTRRHRSLPQINHDRVSVRRPKRAKTLESKVCTTSNGQ